MPVSNTKKPGYVKRSDGKYHKPYGKSGGNRKSTTKGERRSGAKVAGSRKAYDDTKDSRKKPSAAIARKKGVTTKKGMAREGTVAGSRLAFDNDMQDHHHEIHELRHPV